MDRPRPVLHFRLVRRRCRLRISCRRLRRGGLRHSVVVDLVRVLFLRLSSLAHDFAVEPLEAKKAAKPAAALTEIMAKLRSSKTWQVTQLGVHTERTELIPLAQRDRRRDSRNPDPMDQSMLRPLVIAQLLHSPWARKQVISGFLA